MYTERQLHKICFLLSSLFSNWKITSYAIAPNSKFCILDREQKCPSFDKGITNESNFKKHTTTFVQIFIRLYKIPV